ncbi:MAG TPA: hypothetical protein VI583_05130 [Cyclobacteriaceae bacterium]|nr:hypothetical protein [Cyclobacteriaceae bacterium]
MNSARHIPVLIKKLEDIKGKPIDKKVFIGVDGYIDKIQKAVKTRTAGSVDYYPTLKEFAARIDAAAGKSGQVELVTHMIKLGGNAPIMSNALGFLGVENYCLGNAGFPEKHPVYNTLHHRVKTLSIGNPSESAALEFNDGKMILSDLSEFSNLDWEQVKKNVGKDKIQDGMNACDVVALVGWCNPVHATRVWKGILEEIMPKTTRKKLIFFDLADPTKKSKQDLEDVLSVINSFSKYGTVILGLNENETIKLYHVLHGQSQKSGLVDLNQQGKEIFSGLSIEGLLLHPVDRSIYIDKNGIIQLDGKLVKEPKISTGGGDNLNAGFCLGYLLGFSTEESMILGMATSGAYVSNGRSPEIQDLCSYLKTWI